MQPNTLFLRTSKGWLSLAWLTLLAAATLRTAAADFRIEEARLGAGGRLELHFPADPASYYRLLRGDSVTAINTPAALGLAGPLSVAAPAQTGFFRVQQLPRAAALDTDGDGRDDLTELLAGSDPLVRDEAPLSVTQFTSSPAPGDDGVAVTRETVLRFNRPLAPDTVLGNQAFFAEAAGRRVLTRTELAPDRRAATLFYLEPLPGAAQVRVVFDGDKVRDAEGKLVDADADGQPGGVGVVTFTTLNNQPVPRTAVIGRVFASELVPGPDTGTNALNRPLAGVTITVDGQEETLRAVTDAQGNFRLEPAPAGRFFVHVDGRTAAGSAWPDGDYYPFVGKAWEAVPGRTDNLAGGTGEIYLPLIRAGSLRPVSPTEPTPVTFVPEVVAANPALAGVQLVVPPGALFDDNGTRGGRVGIAPVPPDRLPEPLPEGLNFPLVITVQTDGPRNFAQPVPVRFPNLPDPVTGLRLPPGAKTALWSFDHDKGYWEIVGPATVTADGEFVESDPGVGLLQPGWHGVQPGVQVEGGEVVQECESEGDAVLGPIFVTDLGHGRRRFSVESDARTPGIVNWFAATAQPQGLAGDVVFLDFCEPGTHTVRASLAPDCYNPVTRSVTVTISEEEVCSMEPLLFGGSLGMGEEVVFGPFDHTAGTIEWIVEGGRPERGRGETFRTIFCEPGVKRVTRKLRTECGRTCEVTEEFEVVDRTIEPFTGCFTGPALTPIGPFYVGEVQTFYAPEHTAGTVTWDAPQGIPDQGAGDEFRTVFDTPGEKVLLLRFRSECGQECTLEYTRLIEERPPAPQAVVTPPDGTPTPWSVRAPALTQITGRAAAGAGTVAQAAETSRERRVALHAGGGLMRSPVTGPFYFTRRNLETGFEVRGSRGRGPALFPQPRQLAANTRYRLSVVTANGRFGGTFEFTTGDDGSRLTLGDIIVRPLTGSDSDGDGLTDFAEDVLGSNPNRADTDNDSISDLAEAIAGTPLNGVTAEPLGMVAGVPTPGHAWDVTVVGDLAAVADGRGVSVFNVLNPALPALVSRLELPGDARMVAGLGSRLLVGLGAQGLALADLGSLPNLAAPTLRNHPAPVTAVAAGAGFGFVGLENGRIRTVDPATGNVLAEAFSSGAVEDLLVVGTELFALNLTPSGPQVTRWQINGVNLSQSAAAAYDGSRGAGGRRLRLGAAGDRLYATHTAGVAVFDLTGGQLTRLANHRDGQFGWRQLAPDGTGRGIAASDPNSTDDGAHDLQVFDLRPNGDGLRFETQHPTPGSAEALVLSGSFALVADGAAGLTVIRHAEADRFGRPPAVTLRSPFVAGLAEEGRMGVFVADATDDVGVARVELFVDGQLVATDTAAPYEFAVLMPRRTDGRTSVRLRARATDTGGNVGESAELVLTLTGDATVPEVRQLVPFSGSEVEGGLILQVAALLSEPLNPASVTAGALRLFEAGPDSQHGTADDVEVTRGTVNYRPGLPGVTLDFGFGLASGRYRAVLASGLADPAGNAMPEGVAWTFELRRPRVLSHRPPRNGLAAGRSLEVTFSAPMIPASVATGLSVHSIGPDQTPGTADDVRMAGTFSMAPGTPVARLDFSPPLPPGVYRARVAGGVADGAGNTLGTDLTWDFTVVRLDLGTGAVSRNGSLNGPFAADEFLLLVSGNDPVAVSNPNRLDITLFAPDGSVIGGDNRDFFTLPVAGDGPHVLRVAKGDGDFSQNYTLQLNRFTTRTFAHALAGTAPQQFTGRTSQNLADVDVFELTAEPGASYFIEALGAGFPCPHRWSVFDPAGVPAVLETSICSQAGAVVSAPTGGVIRVRVEALRNGVQARIRVTRAQERTYEVTLTAGETYSTGTDPQFSGAGGRLNPGDTALIRFTVPAGARFSFARGQFGACLPWRLTGPDGAVLFEEACPEVALPDTAAGGVFTLRVLNNLIFPQTPEVQVRPVIERVFDLVDLTGGVIHRPPAGEISGPGSRDVHRFLLPGNTPVSLGMGQFSACHDWELVNAAGQRVFGPVLSCDGRARAVTVPAGEYRLIVTGTVNSTDFLTGYSLVAGRPGVETTTHDLRTARLFEAEEFPSLPGHRRVFEVELDADQVVEVRFISGAEGCEEGLTLRLLAPDGSLLLQTGSGECSLSGILQLGAAGRYRLEVETTPDSPPQYWSVRFDRSRLAAGQWLPLPGAEQLPAINPVDGNDGGSALLVRGAGAEIFLAGRFNGQTLIGRLAGGAWQMLGVATRPPAGGFTTLPVVNAIVHDGAALYVAGNFTHINDIPAPGVARWDGTTWTSLGSGVRVTDTEGFGALYEVKDLAFVGGQLYAGGRFRAAGGVATFNLARWDPARNEWAKVTGPQFNEHLDGVGGQRGPNDWGEMALSLATLGDTLFIAGNYQFPGRNVGAWRNHQFADGLLGGVQQSTFDLGEARLVRTANGVAWFQGNFRRAGVFGGNVEVDGFAVWTGTEWRRAPTLLPYHNSTHDFAVDGDRIVVGGSFNRVFNDFSGRPEEERDSIPVNGLAIWDGTVWRSPGLGVQLDLGGGGGGGGGGEPASLRTGRARVVRHDTGNEPPRLLEPGQVNRLQVVDRRIYVTGRFTHAGGRPAPPLAVWESAP